MRISTSQLYSQGINSILDQQAKLSRSQLQLASGNKLLAPSDDPTAASQALDVNQSIDQVGQYQTNTTVARSRLELEDSSLSDVNTSLVRIRERNGPFRTVEETPC